MAVAVQGISHATFETPDLGRMVDYYVGVVGLSLTSRDASRAHLYTATGLPAVTLVQGPAPRCSGVAFFVAPDTDLGEAAGGLRSGLGILAERRTDAMPGATDMLSFADVNGTVIDLIAGRPRHQPDGAARDFAALKLGHIAFKTTELERTVAFYQDVLGFRVSDWREDFFVWMRCGPEHHTANFVRGDTIKMHHVAFELKDGAEILRACDSLGHKGHKVIYGPGRHVIGDNIFVYHRNPDGQIVEFYAELARMDSEAVGSFAPRPWHKENPYRPKVWGPGTVGNLWGQGAPPGFSDG